MIKENYIEEWKAVTDFEDHYEISNFGRVKSLIRVVFHKTSGKKTIPEKILAIAKYSNGYSFVSLWKDNTGHQKMIHRLVGIHFIPNENNLPEINHKNGIKDDNLVSNLEWSSRSDNMKHSYKVLGRKISPSCLGKLGKLHHNSKEVYCPTLSMTFGSAREAARILGISQGSISDICNGKRIQKDGITFNYTNK